MDSIDVIGEMMKACAELVAGIIGLALLFVVLEAILPLLH